jgi:hypothetical protein
VVHGSPNNIPDMRRFRYGGFISPETPAEAPQRMHDSTPLNKNNHGERAMLALQQAVASPCDAHSQMSADHLLSEVSSPGFEKMPRLPEDESSSASVAAPAQISLQNVRLRRLAVPLLPAASDNNCSNPVTCYSLLSLQ